MIKWYTYNFQIEIQQFLILSIILTLNYLIVKLAASSLKPNQSRTLIG